MNAKRQQKNKQIYKTNKKHKPKKKNFSVPVLQHISS